MSKFFLIHFSLYLEAIRRPMAHTRFITTLLFSNNNITVANLFHVIRTTRHKVDNIIKITVIK